MERGFRVPRRNIFWFRINEFFPFTVFILFLTLVLFAVNFFNQGISSLIIYGLFIIVSATLYWIQLSRTIEPKSSPTNSLQHKSFFERTGKIYVLLSSKPFLTSIASMTIFALYGLFLARSDRLSDIVRSNFWILFIPIIAWGSRNIYKRTSELFIILLIIGVLGIVVLEPSLFKSSLDYETISDLGFQITSFVLLSGIIHVLIRRMMVERGRSFVTHQVSNELIRHHVSKNFSSPIINGNAEPYLNEIARLISDKLGYERVNILVHDIDHDWIYLKGSHGFPGLDWPVKGWSCDQRKQKSISGHVVKSVKPYLCKDTTSCKYYFEPAEFNCLSELAVPIIVDGTCIGTLDIQSKHKAAFGFADQLLLTRIAESIGNAFIHQDERDKESVEDFLFFKKIVDSFANTNSTSTALKNLGIHLLDFTGADIVHFFPHAVGSVIPIRKPVQIRRDNESSEAPHHLSPSHRLMKLVEKNKHEGNILKPYFQSYAESDSLLLGSKKSKIPIRGKIVSNTGFVQREDIKSVAWLPLGYGDELVGTAFINFKTRQKFTKNEREKMIALSEVIGLGIELRRQTEILAGPLGGYSSLHHSHIQAVYAILESRLSDLIGNGAQEFDKILIDLEEFRRFWTALIIADSPTIEIASISELIAKLKAILRGKYKEISIVNKIQKKAEFVPSKLKQVVYKLVAESFSNALLHGKATKIIISLKLINEGMELKVINSGIQIRPGKLEASKIAEKQHGIVSLLKEAEKWYGAEVDLQPTKNGTLMKAFFPLNI